MAEQLFKKALTFNVEGNKIEINEKNIYNLGISSARIINACIMAVVKECDDQQSTFVDVVYNNQTPQVIDIIAPKKGDKISINITEELNCLIKFAFQYSGNPKHDDKISILFKSKIVLGDIDLFVEYIPEQIMHENSAYVDYNVRQAGNGKINLATGTLRFTHNCGEVSLVYNDYQTEKRSTTVYDVQGKRKKFLHGVGKGFKLNVEQFLIKRKGTDNQSVYTYVDGNGNYHEFSEKYYYVSYIKDGVKQKTYVPKSKVKVYPDGKLSYNVHCYYDKEVFVERKTTSGLCLEQDYSNFKESKYFEERLKEQIQLEENIQALERQLKKYVIVNRETGEVVSSFDVLAKKYSAKTGKLSIDCYENFITPLDYYKILLTETEAIQYRSLRLPPAEGTTVDEERQKLKNRQINELCDNSLINKEELEKYFKQYYNNQRKLSQMNWLMPKYFVTDNTGTTMGFNKDGYLVVLFDNYNNQTAILYSKGRISSVQDTNNNVLSFEYGKNRRIKRIVTSNGKTYQLFYGEEKALQGLLTKIIDGNGEETYLSYDKYGFLNSVEDNSRFGVQFKYDKYGRVVTVNQTSQIKVVTDSGVEPSTAQQSKTLATVDYNDSHLTTSVTNELGLITTYNFDIVGKVVTMYEGQYSDPEETTRAKSFEYTDNKKSFSISDDITKKNLIADLIGTNKTIILQGTKDGKPCEAMKSIEVDKLLFEKDVTDYVFSVWANADSAYVESARSLQYTNNKIYGITTDAAKKNRKFEVRALVTYEDGECVTFVAGFDWLNTKWQYLAMPIEVKQGKKVAKCVITLDYSYNVKNATFDCLSLREGSWTYKEFDEEGKQTYNENSKSRTSIKYFYDDNDKLVKEELTDSKGRIFTSTKEYNAEGTLVRSINYAGIVTETVLDEKGRELKKIIYNIDDPTSKIYQESKRDEKGKITADMDESGEYDSITYTYDPNDDLAVQSDGKGNKTAFGYKNGNLVSISGSVDGEESVNTMHHTANLLTKTGNGETTYNYEYDCWGRSSSFKIAGEKFVISMEYSDNLKNTIKYADGTSITNVSDAYGNIVKQTVNYSDGASKEARNSFDPETGKLIKSIVDNNGETLYNVNYEYDYKGNTIKEERVGQFALKKEFAYTADNAIKRATYTVNGKVLEYTYETDRTPDKREAKVGLPCRLEQVLAYDGLGRTKEVALGDNLVKDIYYAKYGDHATNRVSSVWHGVNGIRKENTRYTYDKAGNIETITENGKLVARYAYDGLNRLVREDNVRFGTFTYQYDAAGNILSKTEYAFTLKDTPQDVISVKEYSYKQHGWKDQLLSFNGEQFEYDVMGNPTTYRDRTLTWQGRRLLIFAKEGKSATYTYDFNGVRTSKTLKGGKKGTLVVNYIYDGNNLIAEQRGTELITYFYGVDGIAGFEYGDTTYVYRKNIQGDITHIYTEINGKLQLVAQYVYDAWGNHNVLDAKGNKVDPTAETIANFNPFRYRGYYFDAQTGLYYLQTRYYDPELGRFISSDSVKYADSNTINGLNLYAYCLNNPIRYSDKTGTKVQGSAEAEFFSIFNDEGSVWNSGRYVPTIKLGGGFWNDFLYMCEDLLTYLDAGAIEWEVKILTITSTGITIVSASVDLFAARINFDDTNNIAIKIGSASAKLGVDFGDDSLIGGEIKATALTIGAYTEYVDFEFLVGSIGVTAKYENGAIKVGASWGFGIELTIKLGWLIGQ